MKMTNMSTSISIITFTKFVVFVFSLSVVYSLPVTKTKYDQSQQGELNVRADLDNILVLFIPSGGVRLLDSEQIGNIISILGSSRKNAVSSQTSDTKDPPYKIDFEQAAIDKLQSDIDTLNSILPISKNYNKNSKPENKETADETLPQTVNIKEQTTLEDKHESVTSSVVIETTSATSPTSSEAPVPVETKLSTSAAPDVTTSESVITSIPLIKTTEKDTPVMVKQDSEVTVLQTKPAAEDLSSKLHQRVIDTSAKTQTRSSSAQPAKTSTSSSRTTTSSSSKTPKILDEQQNERQLKALQSGLIHCLPGQRLTAAGDCVEIQLAKESRNERMERLLSMLRFGIQPAYSNN